MKTLLILRGKIGPIVFDASYGRIDLYHQGGEATKIAISLNDLRSILSTAEEHTNANQPPSIPSA